MITVIILQLLLRVLIIVCLKRMLLKAARNTNQIRSFGFYDGNL